MHATAQPKTAVFGYATYVSMGLIRPVKVGSRKVNEILRRSHGAGTIGCTVSKLSLSLGRA